VPQSPAFARPGGIWHRKLSQEIIYYNYLTGISRFIGVLEVMGEAYKGSSKIWKDEEFPCGLKVKLSLELTPETAVLVFDLHDKLKRAPVSVEKILKLNQSIVQ
jgi:hypothetical protein